MVVVGISNIPVVILHRLDRSRHRDILDGLLDMLSICLGTRADNLRGIHGIKQRIVWQTVSRHHENVSPLHRSPVPSEGRDAVGIVNFLSTIAVAGLLLRIDGIFQPIEYIERGPIVQKVILQGILEGLAGIKAQQFAEGFQFRL